MDERRRDQLREAEYRALDRARRHIEAAKVLYANRAWPQACFLAMAAVEEIGKYMTIQSARAEPLDAKVATLREDIREHRHKALMGGVPTLVMNDEARNRHGQHPETRLYRLDAVRLLAMSGPEWMKLKNRCLYAELDDAGGDVPRGYAYLFIVGALEAYARVVSPGFHYPGVATEYDDTDGTARRRILQELQAFVSTERAESEVDRIDILASQLRYEEVMATGTLGRPRRARIAEQRRPGATS